MREDLNPSKAPGCDLIIGRILKEMPRKGIAYLTPVCSISRTGYFISKWKVAEIIMIPEPGKPLQVNQFIQKGQFNSNNKQNLRKSYVKRITPDN
jgi:hypothetical protein